MSNSALVNYTCISPNSNNPRNASIKKITIHHMAGNLSVETCGKIFASSARQASSNYGIGSDGRVGMYVEEKNRSWCSSSPSNDHQAVTIEVANDETGGDWHVSDKALAKLIDLCADICQRNGIDRLNYTGDTAGNLTMHCWFSATSWPRPLSQEQIPLHSRRGQQAPGRFWTGGGRRLHSKRRPCENCPRRGLLQRRGNPVLGKESKLVCVSSQRGSGCD